MAGGVQASAGPSLGLELKRHHEVLLGRLGVRGIATGSLLAAGYVFVAPTYRSRDAIPRPPIP